MTIRPDQAARADTIASRINTLAIAAATLRADLHGLAALVDLDAKGGFPGVQDDAEIILSVAGAVDLAASRLGMLCSSWISYARSRDAAVNGGSTFSTEPHTTHKGPSSYGVEL